MTQPRAELAVPADSTDIVPFVHKLGTEDVAVTAFDAAGRQVGYLMANPISSDEVEVVIVPGSVARLVAEPAEEDEVEDGINPVDAFGY